MIFELCKISPESEFLDKWGLDKWWLTVLTYLLPGISHYQIPLKTFYGISIFHWYMPYQGILFTVSLNFQINHIWSEIRGRKMDLKSRVTWTSCPQESMYFYDKCRQAKRVGFLCKMVIWNQRKYGISLWPTIISKHYHRTHGSGSTTLQYFNLMKWPAFWTSLGCINPWRVQVPFSHSVKWWMYIW